MAKKEILKSTLWFVLTLFLILCRPAHSEAGQWITVKDVREEDSGRSQVIEFLMDTSEHKAPDLPQAPGWPQSTWCSSGYCPNKGAVFADLDEDGNLEIIAASTNRKVYVWDYLGNLRPGWPQTLVGMPQPGMAVGDVDGDGLLDIAVGTSQGPGRIYVFDRDGNTLPGWPVSLDDHEISQPPTLSDLDKDGKLEIIVGERVYPIGFLHVFRYDGTEFPGNWPFQLDRVPATGAAVGDIDNDGEKEIVCCSYWSVYALESDGTVMPGWPYTGHEVHFSYNAPALADFQEDGYQEVVCSSHGDNSCFFVLDYRGNLLPGWPRPTPDEWTYCPPSVGDVDQDGDLEIAVGNAGFFAPEYVLHLFDIYGNYLPGFPLLLLSGAEGPICIADIEGDSTMELIFDSNMTLDDLGYLRGAYSNGDSLPAWPLRTFGATYMNGSTVGDVNDDGILEVSSVSCVPYDGPTVEVNLWSLPKSYGKTSIEWGTYHFDNERTGLYRRRSPNQPPERFGLISPDSGAIVSPNPAFVWHSSTNPDTLGGSVTYTLKYSPSPIFWGYEQIEGLTDTSYTFSDSSTPDTIYYWRIKADDGAPDGITWANQGFWWFKAETYVYGDADGDDLVDLSDVVYLARYLFQEGDPPVPLASGDPNDDCVVDIADIVYLLNYIFKDGPEPLQGCA